MRDAICALDDLRRRQDAHPADEGVEIDEVLPGASKDALKAPPPFQYAN
ncbi:MAG TPA: hypothetical protein VEM76_02775 [Anaeromyxobacteraceae bacterium]|nr:hypothetical protein [Anaeromyxobacteraceae bacterium]